jgi:hypothetical protein
MKMKFTPINEKWQANAKHEKQQMHLLSVFFVVIVKCPYVKSMFV